MHYAGDIVPEEAWQAIARDPAAQLVDVRSAPEWQFIGMPDLAALGKKVIALSWRHYPQFAINGDFCSALQNVIPDKEAPIYFLCKTGGRSSEAATAMAQQGYTKCYNILNGFEGDQNMEGQRGKTNGWKASRMPWRQA